MMFPSGLKRINGIASPAAIRLAISRSLAAASSLQASGCIGSSELVLVSKVIRIMVIWSELGFVEWLPTWPLCHPLVPPPGRSRRRESAAESGLPIFPPASQTLPVSPSPEVLPAPDSSPIKQGKIQRIKPCHVASAGWRCLGRDPGCSNAKLGREALDSARGGAPETNRSVQTGSSAVSSRSGGDESEDAKRRRIGRFRNGRSSWGPVAVQELELPRNEGRSQS